MASILIVDDSILMRRNLRMLLTEAGHEVVGEASNGFEAYKEYVKTQPDLVTMDITMPVMSGLDAVKKIIATYPQANIIMISALDQKSMVFEAIQNGAKHYILKPITVEKILHTVEEVLMLPPTEAGDAEAHPLSDLEAKAGAADLNAPPFSIDNKNGIFILTIRPHLDEPSLAAIGTAVQGFLFIKPLKVVVNFGHVESLGEPYLNALIESIQKIQAAGGIVKVVAYNKALIQVLKVKDEQLFHTIYTDMTQIIL
ncbi:response regulator [Paenibacillus sp. HJGM_3]|uniref:response regulator n=1 Tax=Paenibacillus sp. HJGM_3 TaxID=3379816 RepID=UPI00385CB167